MQTMTGSYSEILERPSLPERIVEEDEKGRDENEIDDSKDEVSTQMNVLCIRNNTSFEDYDNGTGDDRIIITVKK